MPAVLVCASLLFFATVCSAQQWSLLPRGSIWSFYADGMLPTNWHRSDFDDRAWRSGPAQLGYGDGDEEMTIVTNPEDAPPTTYFRRTFVITNCALLFNVTLRVLADDGFVIYVNGVERARRNLPAGPVVFDTFAEANIELSETNFVQLGISPTRLQPNANTIAVELHQHLFGLHDASFDLELLANLPFQRPSITITNPPEPGADRSGRCPD